MWLLIAFILVPLIEIALFIQVGGLIGLWPTLAIVVATALAGSLLLRRQGRVALTELRASMGRLSDPTEPLAHGAMIVFAAMLLLTPGFFTDALGLLLLVPDVRRGVIRRLGDRMRVSGVAAGGPGFRTADHRSEAHWPDDMTQGGSDVIDGEYIEMDAPQPKRGSRTGKSGWTRR